METNTPVPMSIWVPTPPVPCIPSSHAQFMHARYLRMPCDSISVFICSLALQYEYLLCSDTNCRYEYPVCVLPGTHGVCGMRNNHGAFLFVRACFLSLSLSFSPLSFSILFCLCEHNPQSADLATRPRLLLAIKANNREQTNLEGLVNSNGHSCGSKQSPRREARRERKTHSLLQPQCLWQAIETMHEIC